MEKKIVKIKINKKMQEDLNKIRKECGFEEKPIQDYKREVRRLKKEIRMLESFLSMAQPEEWDMEGIYEDALNGTFNGNNIGGFPNPKLAKWIKERYNLEVEEDD